MKKIFFVFILMFLAVPSAYASPYLTVNSSAQSISENGGGGNYDAQVISNFPAPTENGPINVSANASSRLGSSSSEATADYGMLKAFATATAHNAALGGGATDWGASSAFSAARFYDEWTIDIPGRPLESIIYGTIDYTLHMSGSVAGYHVPNSGVFSSGAELRFNDDWYSRAATSIQYNTDGSEYVYIPSAATYSQSFIYGTPFGFAFSLAAWGGVTAWGEEYMTSTAAFNNTVSLERIRVLLDDTEINDYTLTAASGHTYDFQETPSVIPEPATLSLLGLGLAGVMIRRKKL